MLVFGKDDIATLFITFQYLLRVENHKENLKLGKQLQYRLVNMYTKIDHRLPPRNPTNLGKRSQALVVIVFRSISRQTIASHYHECVNIGIKTYLPPRKRTIILDISGMRRENHFSGGSTSAQHCWWCEVAPEVDILPRLRFFCLSLRGL
jgi:hypothetical protein